MKGYRKEEETVTEEKEGRGEREKLGRNIQRRRRRYIREKEKNVER